MNHVHIPKPECLDKMLEYAAILGEDFEQVRVDFYEIDGKVYFTSDKDISQGEYYDVLIEKCDDYDLYGGVINESAE